VCGRHLAAVLRGRQDALELLFSESDALAARIYDSSPILSYYSRLARTLLQAAIAEWPSSRPLRVLEVGAGTGSMTALLLPGLRPGATHYTYTDISPAFFSAARERFRRFGFVQYRTLDLNIDPRVQGFTEGSFDVVIASNVLHATNDLAATVRRVASLLADGGHLLAFEMTNVQPILLGQGLLDSFWTAEDPRLRPDGPTLARESWTRLLGECEFRDIAHAGDTLESASTDCTVFLAARCERTAPAGSAGSQVSARARQWLIAALPGQGTRTGELDAALMASVVRPGDDSPVSRVRQPRDPGSWTAALDRFRGPVELVILMDSDAGPGAPPPAITERAVEYCAVLRAVSAACAQAPTGAEPSVWLVAHTGDPAVTGLPPGQGAVAAVWGAARSVANEQPAVPLRRIGLSWPADRPDNNAAAAAGAFLAEVAAESAEDEVLLTVDGRFVPRVQPAEPARHEITDAAASPYALAIADAGSRYQLDWRPAPPLVPGPGEVLISVRAAGLNYRDVLTFLGQLPGTPRADSGPASSPLGVECAGTVIATGPGVSSPAVGDRVMALAHCYPGSHALGRAVHTIPVPDDMTFAEAATMPVAFLTVEHTLAHLARLAPGETLLVHAGAGGVGLAAIEYARHAGASVIATAGTPAKRDLLHLLGVEHVLDSRSLGFADQILALTGGQGVDVVLNSLAGEALTRGLGIVRDNGRFVELGKRDILADNPLPMAAFERNISFISVDIFALVTGGSPVVEPHFPAIARKIMDGVYHPLPHWAFPAARVSEAYAYLQYSRHAGKVVLTHDDPVAVRSTVVAPGLKPDATYLVTGGLAGFGAATARHLAGRGARHLALVSRRGQEAPEAAQLAAELGARGVAVTAYAADAADQADMSRIIDDIHARGSRLAGVVHAAMVLKDAPLTDLPDDDLRAVLAPKMTAGRVLDQLTRGLDLDFFVVFSSATATLGNLKQAAYGAGNIALDAIVRQRHRAGLPALSIQWGAISDTGYVKRNNIVDRMNATGLTAFPARKAMAALSELMADPEAEVVIVALADWARLAGYLPRLAAPRSAGLLPAPDDLHTAEDARDAITSAPAAEALNLTEDLLVTLLANIMQTTPERVGRDRRIDLLGVDSLMANEFTVRIRQALGCAIPAMEVTGSPNMTALAQRVLRAVGRPSAD
jgi:NADPH:quinone reductase-like Zn-dependent oxidoreductase/SAM-dependent methyltransferase/NADP-dependent 3-hydroxy acid dehydrogenase YdfG/acyl carrier protein